MDKNTLFFLVTALLTFASGVCFGNQPLGDAKPIVCKTVEDDGEKYLRIDLPDGEVAKSKTGTCTGIVPNGHWTLHYPDGTIHRGYFIDGKREGVWSKSSLNFDGIETARRMYPPGFTDLQVHFRDDVPTNSPKVASWPSGLKAEGTDLDSRGILQGKWRFVLPGIRQESGTMINGIKQGYWRIKWLLDGTIEEGHYIDGQRTGEWRIARGFDRATESGRYVDGLRDGSWTVQYPDGQFEEGNMTKGRRDGRWKIFWPDGMQAEGRMLNGVRVGEWNLISRHGWEQRAMFRERTVKNSMGDKISISVREGDWTYKRAGKIVSQGAALGDWGFFDIVGNIGKGPVNMYVYNAGGELYSGLLLEGDYGDGPKENVYRRAHGGRIHHGDWKERHSHLGIEQDRAGAWAWYVSRYSYGVLEGPYHKRFLNGDVAFGVAQNNQLQGLTIRKGVNGAFRYVHYAAGKRQGLAYLRYVQGLGIEQSAHLVDEIGLSGEALRHFRVDTFGRYIDDKREGEWVERYADGSVEIGTYNSGVKVGRWTRYEASGDQVFATYD
ncbi:MAG: hypothetical protein OXI22_03905 [Defluviicoccus sp.]|nr:hypothetical protein [Defluviicoccus sp.]